MSITDPADDVQPEVTGQGDGGTTDAPYAEYLNRIPEELRGQVEPVFREWDANTTRRFQDAADFRKTWEPFQDSGITNFQPEEVNWLVQFRQALDNPQAIKQWYDQYAEQNGLQPEMPPQQDQYQQQYQQYPQQGLDDYSGFDSAGIEQVLKSQLGPIEQRLEAFAQWQEQQEHAARVQEADRFVQSQIEDLKTRHPDEFNEQAVEKLVSQYIETDPRNAVQRAFADWQAIRSQVEKDTLQSKAKTPPAAEGGGVPNVNPDEIKTLAQAAEIAKARIRESWNQ